MWGLHGGVHGSGDYPRPHVWVEICQYIRNAKIVQKAWHEHTILIVLSLQILNTRVAITLVQVHDNPQYHKVLCCPKGSITRVMLPEAMQNTCSKGTWYDKPYL